MQIQEHLTHARNCQNYTIHSSKHIHAYVCCSYQNRGNAVQNELNCFNFSPWYVHDVPVLSTFSLLMRRETERGKGALVGCPIFSFLSVSSIQHLWLAHMWLREEGILGFLGPSCSLECHCSSLLRCRQSSSAWVLLNVHTLWFYQNSVLVEHYRWVGAAHVGRIASAHAHVSV